MKKIFIIIVLLTISYNFSRAQFGIGASGGLLHPGFLEAEPSGSKFKAEWGYELFVRHDLIQIDESFSIQGRYAYRHFTNKIKLPNLLDTWFRFNYLTVDLLATFKRFDDISLYTGLGVSLLTINADKDWLNFTGTLFLPEIILGSEWMLSLHYNLFSEISMQFGSIKDVNRESIPITGVRFIIGATMFLTE